MSRGMPPPVTPSPHRFLAASSAKSQNRQLPPSSLRKQYNASSSQQFRPTPRFATQATAVHQGETIDSPTSSPLVSQVERPRKSQDVIDDEDGREDVIEARDEDDPAEEASDDSLDLMLPAPKRKRLSPSPSRSARPAPGERKDLIILSSSPPVERSPSTSPVASRAHHEPRYQAVSEPSNSSVAAPRFRPLGDVAPQTPAASRIGDVKAPLLKTSRPGFVLPPREEAEAGSTILPEVFSPHKKGSKIFVSGGMANMVRDWVLALESKKHRNVLEEGTRGRGKGRAESGRSIVVEAASGEGSGMWTVHARGGERWLLIGSRGYGGEDARRIREGEEISLKPPTWHIDIAGQRWGVAIAWAILDNG